MFAELYLTDGETRIDLLSANMHGVGIGLSAMSMSRPQRAPSGVFRQVYGAVNESYELYITDYNHNGIAGRQQQLDRMLEQAANYFSTNVENQLVYMVARTASETKPRYAMLFSGVIEAYGDLYNQPFVSATGRSTLAITLGLERSAWQANPPTAPECVPLTNSREWNPHSTAWSSVLSLTGVTNGSIFATEAGSLLAASDLIRRSTDNGDNWATELDPTSTTIRFYQFIQIPSGRMYGVAAVPGGSAVGDSGLWYSDNDGDSWTQHTGSLNFYSLAYRADGTLFIGGDGEIRYLPAGGSVTSLSTVPDGIALAMARTNTGAIVAADTYATYRVAPDTLTLVRTIAESNGAFKQILAIDDYLLLVSAGGMLVSRDDGLTWTNYWEHSWVPSHVLEMSDGSLVTGASGSSPNKYVSYDGGFAWVLLDSSGTATADHMFARLAGYLFARAGDAVYRRSAVTSVFAFGPYQATCATPVFVANHRLEFNWTYIWRYDAGGTSYTAFTPEDMSAMLAVGGSEDFFTAPAQVNDALYVGVASGTLNIGWFSTLAVELAAHNATLTIAIEYWNGSSWISLSLQDNTAQLHRTGAVVWRTGAPATTDVNSVTAYWVRFRVTATGALASVVPAFSNLYIVNQPYIELSNVAGDIPALARLLAYNQDDTQDDMQTNRVVVGLRSVQRGERFTAYFNLAQTQNPIGVTVATGNAAAYVTSAIMAPAGQFIRFSPVVLDTWQMRASVTLDSSMARDCAGTYQVYLRYNHGGSTESIQVRMAITNFSDGSAGGQFGIAETDPGVVYGNPVPLKPVTATISGVSRLLHLGQLSIAPDRYLSGDDIGDLIRLAIEAKSSSDTVTLDMYELILIPADEWIGEMVDMGGAGSGDREYIDIDSATFPKRVLRAMSRKRGTDQVASVWQSSASGPAMLQPNTVQRLWFLFGTNNFYNLDDDVVGDLAGSAWSLTHQVKLYQHERWLGLRGTDGN